MAEVIGGMTGALQGTVTGAINKGQSFLDYFLPPDRRAELWAKFTKFAHEKPMLASFLLSQIAVSGIPLGLFAVMTIGVFVFALLAALVIGLLGALLFTVFMVGVALIILLPTLFMTTFAAAFIWLWGVGAYYMLKWFNQKDIPGIHTGAADGILGSKDEKSEHKDYPALNGEAKKHPAPEKKSEKEGKPNGITGKVPGNDKLDSVTKSTGIDKTPVGDVKKKVDKVDVSDVTDKADLGNVTKAADVGNVKNVAGGLL